MNTSVALTRYDAARKALAEAATIDEAKEIRDQAEALRAYARQRDDVEMERWVAEIKLRATIRIGELSRELDTAQGKRIDTQLGSSTGTRSKRETLKAAGISKASAHRAEQLTEPAARQKVEQYIEQQAAAKKPVTITQALKAADVARGATPDAVEEFTNPARPGVVLRVSTRPPQFPRDSSASVRQIYALLGHIRGFLKSYGLPSRILWLTALQRVIEQEIQDLERQARHREEHPPTLLDMVNAAP